MVRKILSVVCIASIVVGTTAGVILRLRNPREASGTTEENEGEIKTREAEERNEASSAVVTEDGVIERTVGTDAEEKYTEEEDVKCTGLSVDRNVVDIGQSQKEGAHVVFAKPMTANSPSPGVVLVYGVTYNRRRINAKVCRRWPSIFGSSPANSRNTELLSVADTIKVGGIIADAKKAIRSKNEGHGDTSVSQTENLTEGIVVNVDAVELLVTKRSSTKSANKECQTIFITTGSKTTEKGDDGMCSDSACCKKSPGRSMFLNTVQIGDEKSTQVDARAAFNPRAATSDKAAVSGASVPFRAVRTSGKAAENSLPPENGTSEARLQEHDDGGCLKSATFPTAAVVVYDDSLCPTGLATTIEGELPACELTISEVRCDEGTTLKTTPPLATCDSAAVSDATNALSIGALFRSVFVSLLEIFYFRIVLLALTLMNALK